MSGSIDPICRPTIYHPYHFSGNYSVISELTIQLSNPSLFSSCFCSRLLAVAGLTWNKCNVTWSNKTGRAASGATYYSQFNTINSCLGACAYLVKTCVAAQVDVSSTPNKCYMITDASNVYNTFAGNGVNLYVLVPVCGSGQGQCMDGCNAFMAPLPI